MTEIVKVNDIEVYLEGQGDETIVMIHGWPDTYRLWDSQVAALKHLYRCARFTLPGYDPAHSRRLYTLEELVAQIADIVDRISPEKPVTLMIHDWGCIWGYQYYLRHQSRVRRIVAVDIGDAGSEAHQLPAKAKLFAFGYQIFLATAWLIGGAVGDAMTRKMAAWLKAPGEPDTIHSGMTYSYWWKWGRTFQNRPLGNLPLKVECPLLFLYGANKAVSFHSEAWEKEMAARPENHVQGLDTGHWVMSEAPQQFNQAVVAWLDRAQSPSTESAA
ncbi:alpha/beta hydrolase [Ferrimonas sediminicola]|uniref:Alpha/beta hydrolase n=1 Tax=Ferrimonas sediminicola TaxID=2569538 RepID=A0A4U1BH13_9GAMM|nr:alpha/beta hydrolase [Ferrimonas sediminicola]TKB50535.1 alpha/beta hydrolase [Ferrimonas sediminicola]